MAGAACSPGPGLDPDRDVAAEVTVDSELRLPYDDDLNLDKATVVVGLTESHEACDLSVQVMADVPPPADSRWELKVSELTGRQHDMQSLLEKLAGMVGKYFLPEMTGVRVSLVQPSGTAYLIDGARQLPLPWQEGQLLLSNAQLAEFAEASCSCRGDPAADALAAQGLAHLEPLPRVAGIK